MSDYDILARQFDELDNKLVETQRELAALKAELKDCHEVVRELAARQAEGPSAIAQAQPDALEMIRRNNFVFQTPLGKLDLTDAERWEKLAFSLYTDLASVSSRARHLLEGLTP